MHYKRGDVVLVNFGFNIRDEFNGHHYAIIVENNNNIGNGVVAVVPLTSVSPKKRRKFLDKSDVFMGKLFNGIDCYAIPQQIRSISKMRIIKPKYKKHRFATVPDNLLDLLDVQIGNLYLSKK